MTVFTHNIHGHGRYQQLWLFPTLHWSYCRRTVSSAAVKSYSHCAIAVSVVMQQHQFIAKPQCFGPYEMDHNVNHFLFSSSLHLTIERSLTIHILDDVLSYDALALVSPDTCYSLVRDNYYALFLLWFADAHWNDGLKLRKVLTVRIAFAMWR